MPDFSASLHSRFDLHFPKPPLVASGRASEAFFLLRTLRQRKLPYFVQIFPSSGSRGTLPPAFTFVLTCISLKPPPFALASFVVGSLIHSKNETRALRPRSKKRKRPSGSLESTAYADSPASHEHGKPMGRCWERHNCWWSGKEIRQKNGAGAPEATAFFSSTLASLMLPVSQSLCAVLKQSR